MFVYRVCKKEHSELDGKGAKLYGGRWNSPGRAVIYTSQNISLAVLEFLVHVSLDNLPNNLCVIEIYLGNPEIEMASDRLIEKSECLDFGNKWLAEQNKCILCVPSIIVPKERNFLINPSHKDFQKVKAKEIFELKLDERLVN